MTSKLLAAGMAVTLLLTVLFFSSCISHSPRGIRHGTVVIISTDADSIILAADSRETSIAFSENKVTFADTAHKIFRIRNTFFAVAGLSELSNMPIREFVSRIYNPARSINENMPVIEAKLKKSLQTELDAYSINERRLLAGHDYSVVLYVTGYEKSKPTLCKITAGVKFVSLFANPVQVFAGTSTGLMFSAAGVTDHIPSAGLNPNCNKLRGMTELISLEARYHTDVDSLVQYVVVKKDGYRTGNNFIPAAAHR